MEFIEFTKLQATGNDFVLVEDFEGEFDLKPKAIKLICDRHFGVGADGLLLLTNSETADYRMIVFNADGTRAEMCGNGIRCFGKYLWDRGHINEAFFKVETDAGIKEVELIIDEASAVGARVSLGEPIFKPESIPVKIKGKDRIFDYTLPIGNKEKIKINAVSMGNPHCVVFIENVDKINLHQLGRAIENHPYFPQKTNVEFVQLVSRKEIRLRVWERGVGETLACGTGAAAAGVVSIARGSVASPVIVKVPGGELIVEWKGKEAFLSGPAEEVYSGIVSEELLNRLNLLSEFMEEDDD